MTAEPPVGILYADTSALVKLVVREAESSAVEAELMVWQRLATSELTAIELPRAVARARSEGRAQVANGRLVLEVLAAFAVVPLTDDVRALAVQIEPVELRTLDAVHLASALTLREDLGAVLTYDRRMAAAAERLDVDVLAPA
jgi:predicted nucleic acid-binding protein